MNDRTTHLLRIERIALAVALVLSLAAALDLVDCGSCRKGPNLGAVGVVFYSGLLLAHLWNPEGSAVRFAIVAAFSAHAALAVFMLSTAQACGLCLAIGGAALFAFAARAWREPRSILTALLVFPLVAVVLIVALGAASVASEVSSNRSNLIQRSIEKSPDVRLTVYELSGCPHCDRLREETLPEIAKRFPGQVPVRFVDAMLAPDVYRTPTVDVQGPRGAARIVGLCTAEELQAALLSAGLANEDSR